MRGLAADTMQQDIPWNGRKSLEDHFRRHGREVGARDVLAYLRSAQETMRVGTRFTYRIGSEVRVGYYHRRTKRFVGVAEDKTVIFTHAGKSENYVRTLRGSTYGRSEREER